MLTAPVLHLTNVQVVLPGTKTTVLDFCAMYPHGQKSKKKS